MISTDNMKSTFHLIHQRASIDIIHQHTIPKNIHIVLIVHNFIVPIQNCIIDVPYILKASRLVNTFSVMTKVANASLK